MRRRLLAALLAPGVLMIAACGGVDPAVPEIDRPEDLLIDVVVEQVPGPTQFFIEQDGAIVAAAINGGESDETGQVIRFDRTSGDQTVLFDGLDKPTGVQRDGDTIYVMEADRLSFGSPVGGDLTVLIDEMPNNGRSEGTITRNAAAGSSETDAVGILFNTSGSARGAAVKEGSGEIRTIASRPDAADSVVLADGFKHAYALTFAAGGTELWAVEIGDGTFDGIPPVDEVVPVPSQGNGGWPRCVGNNRAVEEFDVEQAECDGLAESRAVFPAGSTPTSIVVSPFHDDAFLVALWLTGEIVVVPRQGSDPTDWTVLASGFDNPQHLVVDGDAVYLSEFGADRILKLTRPAGN